MEQNNIQFNFFYQMFQEEFRKIMLESQRKIIGDAADMLDEIFDFYDTIQVTKEERLSIYNQALFNVCTNYVTLSDSSIDILPAEIFEFVDLILDTIHENPYKESFLLSLQFIYQDYLNCLGKGLPTLVSSQDDNSPSSFQITLNSNYKITEFYATNMNLLEQDKIITKFVIMQKENQIGPLPKVLIRIRQDI